MSLFIVGKPELPHTCQALPARLFSSLPNPPQNFFHFLSITGQSSLILFWITTPSALCVEKFDGVLAAVIPVFTDFSYKDTLTLSSSLNIALPQSRQHFFSYCLWHWHPSWLPVSSFMRQRPIFTYFIPPARVSKLMRQQVEIKHQKRRLRFLRDPVRLLPLFNNYFLKTLSTSYGQTGKTFR